jgi:hypothetical protein
MAALALVLDLARACGSCDRGGRLHLWISAAGVVAYASLLVVGLRNLRNAFYGGVFAAAGVHTALGVVMILSGTLCPPCVASLVLALVLAGLALGADGVPLGIAPWTFVAAAVLALASVLPATAKDSARRRDQGGSLEALRASAPRDGSGLRIDVFEMDHCPYCVEFRKRFLPRLRSDFGEALEVAFHDALGTSWVRRTPTLVLADGPVYEGLPHRYEDLRDSLAALLARRNP